MSATAHQLYLCVGEEEGAARVLGVALAGHELHGDVFVGLLIVGPVLVAALLATAQLHRKRQQNAAVDSVTPMNVSLARTVCVAST